MGPKINKINNLKTKDCLYLIFLFVLQLWPRLQNQFGSDQIPIRPRSGPNLVM